MLCPNHGAPLRSRKVVSNKRPSTQLSLHRGHCPRPLPESRAERCSTNRPGWPSQLGGGSCKSPHNAYQSGRFQSFRTLFFVITGMTDTHNAVSSWHAADPTQGPPNAGKERRAFHRGGGGALCSPVASMEPFTDRRGNQCSMSPYHHLKPRLLPSLHPQSPEPGARGRRSCGSPTSPKNRDHWCAGCLPAVWVDLPRNDISHPKKRIQNK